LDDARMSAFFSRSLDDMAEPAAGIVLSCSSGDSDGGDEPARQIILLCKPIFGHLKGYDNASVLQSQVIDPPSWSVMARLSILLPYPPHQLGLRLAVRRVQSRLRPPRCHGRRRLCPVCPVGDDRAPYFSELVASSCTTSVSDVAACSPTPMRGTETRTRPLNAPIRHKAQAVPSTGRQEGLLFLLDPEAGGQDHGRDPTRSVGA
jgi:hypothetical protein